jgi:hypothetical protein
MTSFRSIFAVTFIVLQVIYLVGCASAERERDLNFTLIKYEKALRWATLDEASKYQKVPEEISSSERKRMKSVKVTGYQIISIITAEGEYSRLVEISYYNESTAIERNLTIREDWVFDEEKSVWLLNSKLPRFK